MFEALLLSVASRWAGATRSALALSLAGGLGGAALGTKVGKKIELLGGVVPVAIAVKTVVV